MEHLETQLRKEMADMETRIIARQDAYNKELQGMLAPLVETYKTATTLGKWVMAFLVFISIGLGIALSIRALWPKKN